MIIILSVKERASWLTSPIRMVYQGIVDDVEQSRVKGCEWQTGYIHSPSVPRVDPLQLGLGDSTFSCSSVCGCGGWSTGDMVRQPVSQAVSQGLGVRVNEWTTRVIRLITNVRLLLLLRMCNSQGIMDVPLNIDIITSGLTQELLHRWWRGRRPVVARKRISLAHTPHSLPLPGI